MHKLVSMQSQLSTNPTNDSVFGAQVAKMCVACLHLGHKHQVIEMGAVLAKQRDWHVLRKTGDCLGEIGAKEEAANLRAALAGV